MEQNVLSNKDSGKTWPQQRFQDGSLTPESLGPLCPQSSCRTHGLLAQSRSVLQASQIHGLGAEVKTAPPHPTPCRGLSQQFPEGLVFPYSFHQNVPCSPRIPWGASKLGWGSSGPPSASCWHGVVWTPCRLTRGPVRLVAGRTRTQGLLTLQESCLCHI